MYDEVKRLSNNFRTVAAKILQQKPERIKVFRILLNSGQINFAKMLGISQSAVSALERGIGNILKKEEFEKIAKILSEQRYREINKVEYEQKIKMIALRGRFCGDYAKRMAVRSALTGSSLKAAQMKKPTKQEIRIEEILSMYNIQFKKQQIIKAGRISFVVDFVLTEKDKPRLVVEAKEVNTKYRKKATVCELAYKAMRLRKHNPNIKLIAVFDGHLSSSEQIILEEEFDKLLYNGKLSKIPIFANELWEK